MHNRDVLTLKGEELQTGIGNLATLWLQAGRFQAALRASELILEKHPDYEPALFNAGLSSLALEKEDQAIVYLQGVLEVNPQNANAY